MPGDEGRAVRAISSRVRARSAAFALLVAGVGVVASVIAGPAVAAGHPPTYIYVTDDATKVSVLDAATLKVVSTAAAGPEARGWRSRPTAPSRTS